MIKTIILVLFIISLLSAQFNESIFDGEFSNAWPVYTMDILDQPFPPGFLDDYSAPGQRLWNSQVNWMLRENNLSNIIYIPRKEKVRWHSTMYPKKK